MRRCQQCDQSIDRIQDSEHIHVFQISRAGNKYGHQFFCNGKCMLSYYRALHTVRWKRIRNLQAIYKGEETKLGPLMDRLFGYEKTKQR